DERLLPQDVGVEGPPVGEPVRLSQLGQLDDPRGRWVGLDDYTELHDHFPSLHSGGGTTPPKPPRVVILAWTLAAPVLERESSAVRVRCRRGRTSDCRFPTADFRVMIRAGGSRDPRPDASGRASG